MDANADRDLGELPRFHVERIPRIDGSQQFNKCGRFVGQNSIQLHGGMGMTDEMQIGHYFKRLTMIDTMFGNHAHHLKRYAAM